MKRLPFYQMYPADFDTDENVRGMTDEELGFYLRCLNHAWVNGSLPADIDELARVMRSQKDYVLRVWVRVGKCFVVSPDDPDRMVNPRQEKDKREAQRKSETAQQSAARRWKCQSHANASDSHMPNACETDANASNSHSVGNAESHDVRNANQIQIQIQKKKNHAVVTLPKPAPGTGFLDPSEEKTLDGKPLTDVARRLRDRHPKKSGRELIEFALEKFRLRHGEKADEEFRKLDRAHVAACANHDWTKDYAKYCPKLCEWIDDDRYQEYRARDSPDDCRSDYPAFEREDLSQYDLDDIR